MVAFDLYGCNELMHQPEKLQEKLIEFVQEVKMTIRQIWRDDWENGATTIVIVLAESHIRVETWPEAEEDNYVNGDVQICNFSTDNKKKVELFTEKIISALKPTRGETWSIQRGPHRQLKIFEKKSF
jgi:S-adenosylmethionine/arginine decarboxylase-like enzyme